LKQKTNVIYYLILSITAAIMLLTLAVFNSSNTASVDIYDKLFVGGVFITSCLFGISLAIYPGWFKRFTKQEKQSTNKKQTQKTARKRKGHHPDCDQFQNHTIRINNKILCAGCLGLSIGAILSIFLMILYIVIGNELSFTTFYFFMFLGLIIIGLVYIEIMLPIRHAIIHVISNAFLVISFLLIVICIFEITDNKIYGTTGILLSFLWLDTRIQLSYWQHSLICNNCTEQCKMY
jgi:hypothetical protein